MVAPEITPDVWNQYVAPVPSVQEQILLAIYFHMIDAGLYLPDYPPWHIITFQIEKTASGNSLLAPEMKCMCRIGGVTT